MSDDIDNLRDELREVRELKETLREEIEDLRRERKNLRSKARIRRESSRRTTESRHAPRGPFIDLSGMTESLSDMMEGINEQIQASVEGIGDFRVKVPPVRVHRAKRKWDREEIEQIPPERVAEVISPLGSEERLRILEFLKDGAKSFNELENHVGRTGSSLTHHLNPLLEAGYVVKGEVRGTYYITIEGRLAYRLSQWLTSQVEDERRVQNGKKTAGTNGEVSVEFDKKENGNDVEEDDEFRSDV
ncbi:MAG: ArsR family transcriptional regulator [Candidatus Lokiarchaeota archaeon]|nr:ArsR family transcriptional regulator [Candidatus Lokiarchaeota archaeon]